MADRSLILMLGFGDQHDALAGRLLLLNFRALRAMRAEEAVTLMDRTDAPVRVGLVPVAHAFSDLTSDLDQVSGAAPALGIQYVAIGRRPRAEEIQRLRAARVRYGLWEPFNDSELRFVVNQALYDRTRGETRGELRVPTNLLGRVMSAAGEKPVLIYNLSTGGAFLETHRPTGSGGRIRLELPVEEGNTITVPARVISTNVPGNLQRPNLPMGMGVEYEDLSAENREAIEKYVHARARAFEL